MVNLAHHIHLFRPLVAQILIDARSAWIVNVNSSLCALIDEPVFYSASFWLVFKRGSLTSIRNVCCKPNLLLDALFLATADLVDKLLNRIVLQLWAGEWKVAHFLPACLSNINSNLILKLYRWHHQQMCLKRQCEKVSSTNNSLSTCLRSMGGTKVWQSRTGSASNNG